MTKLETYLALYSRFFKSVQQYTLMNHSNVVYITSTDVEPRTDLTGFITKNITIQFEDSVQVYYIAFTNVDTEDIFTASKLFFTDNGDKLGFQTVATATVNLETVVIPTVDINKDITKTSIIHSKKPRINDINFKKLDDASLSTKVITYLYDKMALELNAGQYVVNFTDAVSRVDFKYRELSLAIESRTTQSMLSLVLYNNDKPTWNVMLDRNKEHDLVKTYNELLSAIMYEYSKSYRPQNELQTLLSIGKYIFNKDTLNMSTGNIIKDVQSANQHLNTYTSVTLNDDRYLMYSASIKSNLDGYVITVVDDVNAIVYKSKSLASVTDLRDEVPAIQKVISAHITLLVNHAKGSFSIDEQSDMIYSDLSKYLAASLNDKVKPTSIVSNKLHANASDNKILLVLSVSTKMNAYKFNTTITIDTSSESVHVSTIIANGLRRIQINVSVPDISFAYKNHNDLVKGLQEHLSDMISKMSSDIFKQLELSAATKRSRTFEILKEKLSEIATIATYTNKDDTLSITLENGNIIKVSAVLQPATSSFIVSVNDVFVVNRGLSTFDKNLASKVITYIQDNNILSQTYIDGEEHVEPLKDSTEIIADIINALNRALLDYTVEEERPDALKIRYNNIIFTFAINAAQEIIMNDSYFNNAVILQNTEVDSIPERINIMLHSDIDTNSAADRDTDIDSSSDDDSEFNSDDYVNLPNDSEFNSDNSEFNSDDYVNLPDDLASDDYPDSAELDSEEDDSDTVSSDDNEADLVSEKIESLLQAISRYGIDLDEVNIRDNIINIVENNADYVITIEFNASISVEHRGEISHFGYDEDEILIRHFASLVIEEEDRAKHQSALIPKAVEELNKLLADISDSIARVDNNVISLEQGTSSIVSLHLIENEDGTFGVVNDNEHIFVLYNQEPKSLAEELKTALVSFGLIDYNVKGQMAVLSTAAEILLDSLRTIDGYYNGSTEDRLLSVEFKGDKHVNIVLSFTIDDSNKVVNVNITGAIHHIFNIEYHDNPNIIANTISDMIYAELAMSIDATSTIENIFEPVTLFARYLSNNAAINPDHIKPIITAQRLSGDINVSITFKGKEDIHTVYLKRITLSDIEELKTAIDLTDREGLDLLAQNLFTITGINLTMNTRHSTRPLSPCIIPRADNYSANELNTDRYRQWPDLKRMLDVFALKVGVSADDVLDGKQLLSDYNLEVNSVPLATQPAEFFVTADTYKELKEAYAKMNTLAIARVKYGVYVFKYVSLTIELQSNDYVNSSPVVATIEITHNVIDNKLFASSMSFVMKWTDSNEGHSEAKTIEHGHIGLNVFIDDEQFNAVVIDKIAQLIEQSSMSSYLIGNNPNPKEVTFNLVDGGNVPGITYGGVIMAPIGGLYGKPIFLRDDNGLREYFVEHTASRQLTRDRHLEAVFTKFIRDNHYEFAGSGSMFIRRQHYSMHFDMYVNVNNARLKVTMAGKDGDLGKIYLRYNWEPSRYSKVVSIKPKSLYISENTEDSFDKLYDDVSQKILKSISVVAKKIQSLQQTCPTKLQSLVNNSVINPEGVDSFVKDNKLVIAGNDYSLELEYSELTGSILVIHAKQLELKYNNKVSKTKMNAMLVRGVDCDKFVAYVTSLVTAMRPLSAIDYTAIVKLKDLATYIERTTAAKLATETRQGFEMHQGKGIYKQHFVFRGEYLSSDDRFTVADVCFSRRNLEYHQADNFVPTVSGLSYTEKINTLIAEFSSYINSRKMENKRETDILLTKIAKFVSRLKDIKILSVRYMSRHLPGGVKYAVTYFISAGNNEHSLEFTFSGTALGLELKNITGDEMSYVTDIADKDAISKVADFLEVSTQSVDEQIVLKYSLPPEETVETGNADKAVILSKKPKVAIDPIAKQINAANPGSITKKVGDTTYRFRFKGKELDIENDGVNFTVFGTQMKLDQLVSTIKKVKTGIAIEEPYFKYVDDNKILKITNEVALQSHKLTLKIGRASIDAEVDYIKQTITTPNDTYKFNDIDTFMYALTSFVMLNVSNIIANVIKSSSVYEVKDIKTKIVERRVRATSSTITLITKDDEEFNLSIDVYAVGNVIMMSMDTASKKIKDIKVNRSVTRVIKTAIDDLVAINSPRAKSELVSKVKLSDEGDMLTLYLHTPITRILDNMTDELKTVDHNVINYKDMAKKYMKTGITNKEDRIQFILNLLKHLGITIRPASVLQQFSRDGKPPIKFNFFNEGSNRFRYHTLQIIARSDVILTISSKGRNVALFSDDDFEF